MLFDKLLANSAIHLKNIVARPFTQAALSGSLTRERYLQFLHDLYPIVWHFVPSMAAAASRCQDDYRDLRYALYEHIEEEKGHEQLVLKDIESVGGEAAVARALTAPPNPLISAMYGHNYWAADRQHPATILGMIFMLECISQRLAGNVASNVQKALGLDPSGKEAVEFLAYHGPADEKHMDELRAIVDAVTDPKVQALVEQAVEVNFTLFTATLN